MKRAGIWILVILIMLLSGCDKEKSATSHRYDTKGFAKLLNMQLIKTSKDKKENESYVDITPEDIYKKIGCQIFKNSSTSESFLVYKNKIYPIGRGFGGFGIASIQLCDFNKDGQYDLIYTDSWGSGMHRWEIGLFDFATMKDGLIFSSLGNTAYENEDVILEPVGENHFNLYTVKLNLKDNNFAKLDYSKEELIGEVTQENNMPKVILFENRK